MPLSLLDVQIASFITQVREYVGIIDRKGINNLTVRCYVRFDYLVLLIRIYQLTAVCVIQTNEIFEINNDINI